MSNPIVRAGASWADRYRSEVLHTYILMVVNFRKLGNMLSLTKSYNNIYIYIIYNYVRNITSGSRGAV